MNIIDGRLVSNKTSKFHEKVAIYEDYEGERLLTLGSLNETGSGYTRNRESISVQEGWRSDELLNQCMEEFDRLWNNLDPNTEVMPIPEALEKDLISFAPTDSNYRFRRKKMKGVNTSIKEKTNERKLRDYQQDAIDRWVENGRVGILNMATGTGKTFTALNAIKQKCSTEEGILLIVVPQYEIAKQWEKDCREVFGSDVSILMCSGHNSSWKKDIEMRLHVSLVEFNILIVINNTFSRDYYYNFIKPYLKRITLLGDEVHEMGATKAKSQLERLDDIPRRLGLSATPERMRDPDGNEAICRFFGNQVYYYSMHEAIYPSSGDYSNRYLCPYNYYVHYSSLNSEELDRYHEITGEIRKYYSPGADPDSARVKKYDQLCRLRSLIIKGSENRLDKLMSILKEYDCDLNPNVGATYSKCIIYCNTIKESKKIYSMMRSIGLSVVEYHNDVGSRESILESFSTSSFIRYVISIGCLDQGVDLPVCDGAIIMSSTSNERQYIQRRGRVLRTNGGRKKMAYIHDILVTPYEYEDLIYDRKHLDDIESSIITKQIKRIETFIDDSDNLVENEDKLLELKRIL